MPLDEGDGGLEGLRLYGGKLGHHPTLLQHLAGILLDHHRRGGEEDERHQHAETHLGDELVPPGETLLILLEDFDVVVRKAEPAEPERGNDHQDDVDIVEPAEEQRRDQDSREDDQPAHRGGALLGEHALDGVGSHGIADLLLPQEGDDLPTDDDGDDQADDDGKGGAGADVIEYRRPAEVLRGEVVEEVVQHRLLAPSLLVLKDAVHLLHVAEVVPHPIDLLIGLVPLAGDEDDVSRLSHGAGGADRLPSVHKLERGG